MDAHPPQLTTVHRRGESRVLSLMPGRELRRLMGMGERQRLTIGTVLYPAGGAIAEVHFPLSGMVSMVVGSEAGGTIEVGVVGNEGMACASRC